jgi:cytochrome c oxidase cbb3-type subunit 4
MSIDSIFSSASSVMTVISFITFIGILVWVFVIKRRADFDKDAQLPFADDDEVEQKRKQEADKMKEDREHG